MFTVNTDHIYIMRSSLSTRVSFFFPAPLPSLVPNWNRYARKKKNGTRKRELSSVSDDTRELLYTNGKKRETFLSQRIITVVNICIFASEISSEINGSLPLILFDINIDDVTRTNNVHSTSVSGLFNIWKRPTENNSSPSYAIISCRNIWPIHPLHTHTLQILCTHP